MGLKFFCRCTCIIQWEYIIFNTKKKCALIKRNWQTSHVQMHLLSIFWVGTKPKPWAISVVISETTLKYPCQLCGYRYLCNVKIPFLKMKIGWNTRGHYVVMICLQRQSANEVIWNIRFTFFLGVSRLLRASLSTSREQ